MPEKIKRSVKSTLKNGKKVVAKPKKKGISSVAKRNISIVIMMCIVAIATYILIATLSYTMSWSADQSILKGTDMTGEVLKNDTGRIGALIADVIVSDWFGIFGIMLPISAIILAFFIVYHKKYLFLKMSLSVVSGMVIWSTAGTFFTPWLIGLYGSSIGGGFGLVTSHLLQEYIGVAGTFLILLLALVLWSLFTFPKSLLFFEVIYKSLLSVLSIIFSGRGKKNIGDEEEESDNDEKKEETSDKKNTATVSSAIDRFVESDGNILGDDDEDEDEDDKFNSTIPVDEDIPFSFNVPTLDEKERAGTHRDDMRRDEFQIVVGADTQIEEDENGDSVIIKTESDALDIENIDQTLFDPTLELSRYKTPPIDLLEERQTTVKITESEIHENKERILNTLRNFSIEISSIRATVGPTVTLYEIVPAIGVKISKIKNLEDDIALSLSALGIRIIAPMPGKGTIGIEVPNKNKEVVSMYSVITSSTFQDSDADLPIVLGRTIQNQNFVVDLAKMPHMLVAGATGQGKSVGLNAIITSLLYKKHPSELKFVMVDPKKVELSLYASLENHFLAKMEEEPDAIITDTQRVISTLNSLCMEMDDRYELLKAARMKNIKEYNAKFKNRRLNPNKGHRFMPYIVVIIDEFADLIMTAGKEIETPISRIAQLARAVGIHLVIATQRPAVNVITGVIKANFPARIAFRVMTSIDSKIILDSTGANQLIGRGDMLVSVGGEITRVQCAFIDTPEIERIAEFIGDQAGFGSAMILPEYVPESDRNKDNEDGGRTLSKRDALFDEIARYVVINQQGSASTIQRNFSIGFNRAGRVMDQLERAGIVGKQQGSKPRDVKIMDLTSLELLLYDLDNNRFNVD